MNTHNICFYGEISKIIPSLSPNTHLFCSTETPEIIAVIIRTPEQGDFCLC